MTEFPPSLAVALGEFLLCGACRLSASRYVVSKPGLSVAMALAGAGGGAVVCGWFAFAGLLARASRECPGPEFWTEVSRYLAGISW